MELINTFEQVNNCKVPYVISERRLGDVALTIANNQLALATLDWHSKRSLEDICRDGWKWQTLNPNGY